MFVLCVLHTPCNVLLVLRVTFYIRLASDPLQEIPPTPPVQSTDTAAIIGGTLGAIAVLVISCIVLLIIFLLQFNRRTTLKKL